LLLAGYHRAYAVASQIVPEGTVRVLLVTLISRNSDRFLGLASDRPEVRDKVRGGRPVLVTFSTLIYALMCTFENKDARFLYKFRRVLGKVHEQDREIILFMEQKMAHP
jgi:hypothetical protein